jgi:GH43 family beta-xylosidase
LWTHEKDSDPNAKEIWAPELHEIGGAWYIYYSADDGNNNNHRMFALVSNGGPYGPFHEAHTHLPHGQIAESTGDWAIDPDVFVAADGNLYLTWSCTDGHTASFPQSLCLARMQNPIELSSASVVLSSPNRPWELRGDPIEEGPVGYTRGGHTYITYSASASFIANDYAVGVLSLKLGNDPMKPSSWIKSGPIFDHHGSTYGPGSVVFVPSLDGRESWVIYHATDSLRCKPAYVCRSIRMQKMHFRSDGFPLLGMPVDAGVALAKPSGENHIREQ